MAWYRVLLFLQLLLVPLSQAAVQFVSTGSLSWTLLAQNGAVDTTSFAGAISKAPPTASLTLSSDCSGSSSLALPARPNQCRPTQINSKPASYKISCDAGAAQGTLYLYPGVPDCSSTAVSLTGAASPTCLSGVLDGDAVSAKLECAPSTAPSAGIAATSSLSQYHAHITDGNYQTAFSVKWHLEWSSKVTFGAGGQFVDNLRAILDSRIVSWGYQARVDVRVDSNHIENIGTDEAPIASVPITVSVVVKTPITVYGCRVQVSVNGDGTVSPSNHRACVLS